MFRLRWLALQFLHYHLIISCGSFKTSQTNSPRIDQRRVFSDDKNYSIVSSSFTIAAAVLTILSILIV